MVIIGSKISYMVKLKQNQQGQGEILPLIRRPKYRITCLLIEEIYFSRVPFLAIQKLIVSS